MAWRAIGRGGPPPGERVAVVGDGMLALVTAHLLRLYSPAELIVCGQRPAQAGLAAELTGSRWRPTLTCTTCCGPAPAPAAKSCWR